MYMYMNIDTYIYIYTYVHECIDEICPIQLVEVSLWKALVLGKEEDALQVFTDLPYNGSSQGQRLAIVVAMCIYVYIYIFILI